MFYASTLVFSPAFVLHSYTTLVLSSESLFHHGSCYESWIRILCFTFLLEVFYIVNASLTANKITEETCCRSRRARSHPPRSPSARPRTWTQSNIQSYPKPLECAQLSTSAEQQALASQASVYHTNPPPVPTHPAPRLRPNLKSSAS